MKRLDIISCPSMDQKLSVRIIMPLSSSTPRMCSVTSEKFYIRLGRLVIMITHNHEAEPQIMLRRILIAMLIYPKFLRYVVHTPGRVIRRGLLSRLFRTTLKRHTSTTLPFLLELSAKTFMATSPVSHLGGVLRISYSQNVTALMTSLYMSDMLLTESYLDLLNSITQQK